MTSLRGYAKHRGVTLRAVQKAIHSGRIATSPEGKIDPSQADAEWDRNTSPRPQTRIQPIEDRTDAAVTTSHSAPEGGSGLDYARARTIKEGYLARLTKIEYEERSGKLISRDEVKIAAFNQFRTFRDGLLNIPERLSAVLAAETKAHRVHICAPFMNTTCSRSEEGDKQSMRRHRGGQ